MDITEPSRKGAAHPTTSKSARGVSLSINQAPNAIRQLIHRWLTDKEADKNLLRFQEACIPNRQLFWSGMHREEAQKWADSHGLQTLTTALGPLLYHGDPSPQTQAPTRFIHGASIIFAWFVSQGDLVTVLSHPPPQFFHPSGQTFYQLYEEPIIKGKLGNRPLRPNFSSAPLLTSKRPESKDPANKSVTDTKNKITKGGQQKTKKNKKKVSSTVADQGKNPMPKKSLKSGTSSNIQQLVKTAVISKKQNVETGIKKKSKKKKRKKEQKLAIEQAQAQPNAKQGQKKLATMAKAKGSKTGAKVKATTKSVIKNGK
ncbi:uncharacterized protein FFMR_13808 [Fusarium fujikuroi]|nr:uncharacterized protein FFMR_13808 [Fusarium fujikuroi]